MSYIVTTVSGTTHLNDLGYRIPLVHPTSINLTSKGITLDQINGSKNLQAALTLGTVTATLNGVPVEPGVDVTALPIINVQIINVKSDAGYGEFTSVNAAIQSITDATSTKPYLVVVGPGIYTEPLIDLTLKPYVTIKGSSISSTIIQPDASTHHVFDL